MVKITPFPADMNEVWFKLFDRIEITGKDDILKFFDAMEGHWGDLELVCFDIFTLDCFFYRVPRDNQGQARLIFEAMDNSKEVALIITQAIFKAPSALRAWVYHFKLHTLKKSSQLSSELQECP